MRQNFFRRGEITRFHAKWNFSVENIQNLQPNYNFYHRDKRNIAFTRIKSITEHSRSYFIYLNISQAANQQERELIKNNCAPKMFTIQEKGEINSSLHELRLFSLLYPAKIDASVTHVTVEKLTAISLFT